MAGNRVGRGTGGGGGGRRSDAMSAAYERYGTAAAVQGQIGGDGRHGRNREIGRAHV